MPLLYSSYADLESNQLNRAKNRIFKSAVTQYKKVGDIQSTVQPTKTQMREYFSRITLFLKQMLNIFNIIIHPPEITDDQGYRIPDYSKLGQKLSIDYAPMVQEFIHLFQLSIFPVYNYFNAQQNEMIKELLLKVNEEGTQLQFYGIPDEPTNNFIETLDEGLALLGEAVDSYSPLNINLKTGRKLMTDDIGEEIQGGYIAGGFRNKGMKYPEIRFR